MPNLNIDANLKEMFSPIRTDRGQTTKMKTTPSKEAGISGIHPVRIVDTADGILDRLRDQADQEI